MHGFVIESRQAGVFGEDVLVVVDYGLRVWGMFISLLHILSGLDASFLILLDNPWQSLLFRPLILTLKLPFIHRSIQISMLNLITPLILIRYYPLSFFYLAHSDCLIVDLP